MKTNVIKLRFLHSGIPAGKEYTYFSNSDVVIGDIVDIDGNKQGIITQIDVPESEIASFKDKAKTIVGKIEKETPKSIEELDEELCEHCPSPEEAQGVHCYGGKPVMCEGSRCKEAYQNYLDEFEEDK